jgi:hypothetical protein
MLTVVLNPNKDDLYSPANGEPILTNCKLNFKAKSLVAIVVDKCISCPEIYNSEFANIWDQLLEKYNSEKMYSFDLDAFEKFIDEYNAPSWLVFRWTEWILTCGGSGFRTYWIILDLNTPLIKKKISHKRVKNTTK